MKRIGALLLVLCMAFGSSACMPDSNSGTLRYIVFTTGGNVDQNDRVQEEMNKIIEEKLGFKVSIEYYGYTEYEDKLNLILESGESFDMCYTGSALDLVNYSAVAYNNYFYDITQLLPANAPELYASLTDYWDAVKINGKIYGTINEQIFARSVGMNVDKELWAREGYTDNQFDSYESLVNTAMAAIKSDASISPNGRVPATTLVLGEDISAVFLQGLSWDELGASSYAPGVVSATGDGTVFNQYETQEFYDYCVFIRSLYDNGYLYQADNENNTVVTANQRVRAGGTYKPGAESDLYNSIGREFVQVGFGTPTLTTKNVSATMTAISAKSKNAANCLRFLNLLYTDTALYNLFAYGSEDIDYTWETFYDDNNEEYQAIMQVASSKYKFNTGWAVGCELNSYRQYLQSATVAADTRKLNAEAQKSIAYGFSFNQKASTEIKLNTALCVAIAEEHCTRLLKGLYPVNEIRGKIDTLNAELATSGSAAILAEKQSQLNAFLGK